MVVQKTNVKIKILTLMCGRNAPWQFSPAPALGVFDRGIALTLWKQRE
tara:strand:- start:136 stop:279 length:144 start_codon:yes stop_codon:yes gene_type:complete